MADSDLKVNVTTTADVTGIKQVSDEMKALQSVADRTGESLAQVQARFAEGPKLIQATTEAAKKTTEEIQFTRSEAAALANEFLKGEVSARGLATSLGEFGSTVAIAGVAAFTLVKAIFDAIDAQKKLNEEAVKLHVELERASEQWERMAREATTIGDQVHIADAIHANVQKASDELDAFRRKELSSWDQFKDLISKLAIFDITGVPGEAEFTKQEKAKQLQDDLNARVRAGVQAMKDMTDATAAFNVKMQEVAQGKGAQAIADQTKNVQDLTQAVTAAAAASQADSTNQKLLDTWRDLIDKLNDAKTKLAELQATQNQYTSAVEASAKAWDKVTEGIIRALDKEGKLLDEQNKKTIDNFIKREDEQQKIEDQDRILLDAGNAEAVIQDKVTQRVHQRSIELRQIGIYGDENTRQSLASGEALRHELEVQQGQGKAQSDLNVQMKDYETILQNIRQQQQVTQAQAFIGPDQKNLQLLQQYRAEIVNIINAMRQQQTIKNTLTDPAEIAKANQELQKFSAQYQMLAAKITTTTHQFQAGLQSWADSFGSVGTQLANTLQQTVGVALQSFNQWIVTGKFNMQSLLQSIAQLGLQLVEQLIIQRVVALINARLAEAQAVASSKIISAAWASAATAVTIATEGEAAYAAPGAVAIALGGVQAALGLGSLHEGGPVERRRMHSGGLAHDEVPIIAQEGEIMIQRSVAQAPGMQDFLLGLNSGMYHSGGFVAGRRYHYGSDDNDPFGRGDWWNNRGSPFTPPTGGGSPFFNPPDLPPISPGPPDLGQPPFTQPPTVTPPSVSPPSIFDRGNPSLPSSLDFGDRFSQMTGGWAGYGTSPSTGIGAFGPTMIPTNWINYPGVGLVPMAIPIMGPDYVPSIGIGGLPGKKQAHSGGLITRMHSGGGVSGGRGGGGVVHIYAFTDLKALTKHMGSKDGQKIIFDTVKGRRIDLGIT